MPTALRKAGSILLDSYAPRVMLCLALALIVLLLCVRAPSPGSSALVGWTSDASSEDLVRLKDLHRADALLNASAAPATAFASSSDQPAGRDAAGTGPDDTGKTSAEAEDRPAADTRASAPIQRAAIVDPRELPRMRAGLGRFYMRIAYPEEARRAGIEGQLVLDFVVEPDGRVSDVTLAKSLHPLCDSSAIHSLKATRFTPLQQNGTNVRTRARLPVRFELLPPVSSSAKSDTALAALR